nr:PREDICTED: IQ domain-containing protein D-like [Linepithema humile]
MYQTQLHELRPKNKSRPSSERSKSPLNTSSSKIEDSEGIGMQNMRKKIPQVDPFTPLEAAAMSCVLEECLDQLATIEFMIPADVDPRWDETFKTIDEMYGMPDEPRTIFREDMGLPPIVPTAAEKLQRDRYYVYKVLERVLRDVKDNRRFDSLLEEVHNIVKKQEDECNLEESAQIWHSEAEQLRELLESDKKVNEDDRTRTIKLAQESNAQVDHTIFLNSGKLGYAEKWAKARLEQQELKLHLQKKDMLNRLSDYSREYNEEQVNSAEVSNYLEADVKEKEKQLIAWTKKYNEEIGNRQQEIDDLRMLIEDQRSDIEKMRALKKKREEFIDESKRLEEEAKHREKLNKSATIIQSVWRGHMVRHQLGKYKNLWKRKKRKRRKKQSKKAKKSA